MYVCATFAHSKNAYILVLFVASAVLLMSSMLVMTSISEIAITFFLGAVINKVSSRQRCLGWSLSNIVCFYSSPPRLHFQGDNSTGFLKHSSTPPISKHKESPYFSNNSGGVEIDSFELKLLKTHGT